MLHNLEWLEPGQSFPPLRERERIKRYRQNEQLFDGDHFGDELRTRDAMFNLKEPIGIYTKCAERISQVVGNFDDIISFPVLLNYQRLMSLKMADLICGEYPTITGSTKEETSAIKDVRDYTAFDEKLYEAVIDISRYGDAIIRMYLDDDGRKTFTVWDPKEWYPIVSQDGTNTILAHVLCWRVNLTQTATDLPPNWELHAQIHWCGKEHRGTYEERVYKLSGDGGAIQGEYTERRNTVDTGFDDCAVFSLRAFKVSNTVYGYDDYMPLDSILAEIMVRIGQISVILDKHADPNITGPASMLDLDPQTGEYHLRTGKFFATSVGENEPKYMTWDGQLTAAFNQLEFLVNQLYILSEMGAAILGGADGSTTAISGTAMRFKMVNPLAKVRRVANSLTLPVRKLISALSADAEVEPSSSSPAAGLPVQPPEEDPEPALQLPIPYKHISVFWADGLPDDPRENIENCKLATGVTKMMPLHTGIMEYFSRSTEEADQWIKEIDAETMKNMQMTQQQDPDDPNKPGPQDGTGVNPNKKGSETGLTNFHSQTNGES